MSVSVAIQHCASEAAGPLPTHCGRHGLRPAVFQNASRVSQLWCNQLQNWRWRGWGASPL